MPPGGEGGLVGSAPVSGFGVVHSPRPALPVGAVGTVRVLGRVQHSPSTQLGLQGLAS